MKLNTIYDRDGQIVGYQEEWDDTLPETSSPQHIIYSVEEDGLLSCLIKYGFLLLNYLVPLAIIVITQGTNWIPAVVIFFVFLPIRLIRINKIAYLLSKYDSPCNEEENMTDLTKHNRKAIVLCLLFGYLGIHKFYEKKVVAGLLYLFTLGGLTFAWEKDLREYEFYFEEGWQLNSK